MFLDKTLYTHGASLHPGVSMGTGEFSAGGNSAINWHPIINRDKLRPDEPQLPRMQTVPYLQRK